MAAALGVAPDRFLTAYQIHSPDVIVADDAVASRRARPRADAIVTRMPGIAHRHLDRRLRAGAVRRCARRA